ncbi:MAG: arginine--tRNA ligase [Bacilli bacterium]|nr:arginine--tRNA ligase [Bacilli bacterium]
MKDFIIIQENNIKEAIKSLGYDVDIVKLNVSSVPSLGDYQYNGSMALAKELHQNPRDIANNIVEKLDKRDIEKITIDGPGFINITFKNEALINYFNDYELKEYENNNINVVMDYGSPNVAKALHVGHLRSANIGEALKRLAKFLGYNVIADNYIGDWGRPMGLIILELKKKHPDWKYFDENYDGDYPVEETVTNEELEYLYPIASNKAKEDELYLEEARIITNKLQHKEKGYYDLWQRIVEVSINNIKRLYSKLNVEYDTWNGEAYSDKFVNDVIEYFKNSGLTKISDGATIVDVAKSDDKLEIPPVLLIKSSGAVSYETTDLATIWDRTRNMKTDEIWYVVDNRQALHFEQVFRASYKSKMVSDNLKLDFLGFGTMNGKDGKPFKTRDGGVMPLETLMNLVKEETIKKINTNFSDQERENIADILSVAALKYADLLPVRQTDYIFDIEKFCDLNGKTGIYLLYSIVRANSLIKKVKENNIDFNNLSKIKGSQDRDVLIKLLQVDSVLKKSMEEKSLSFITDYLYQLSKTYNSFYDANKILIENDEILRESWIVLTTKYIDVATKLTNILAIEIPDKM